MKTNQSTKALNVCTSFTQAECCSSYAFGALGALEGVHALATGTKVDLSAQNILDCSCTFTYSYKYIILFCYVVQ